MLSTSVSLPSLGSTSKRGPKSLMSTSGLERSLFSGESSAGPGTYGSVQYIENLETKLMGSKKSEDRMMIRIQKLEEELFLQRQKNERLRMTGLEDDAGAEERATRLKLESCRRDLKKSVKKYDTSVKAYEGRQKLLEETVGDVQTELTHVLAKLRFTEKENSNMKEEMEAVEVDKGLMAKERMRNKEEMAKERGKFSADVEALTIERDKLREELRVTAGSLKQKNEMLEREVRQLRDKIKPLEGSQARAERLEEQVKDLNEARKARRMYEDRMRSMEDQKDKAAEERRAQKKKIEELEAHIASMGDVSDQLAKAEEESKNRDDQMEKLQNWLTVIQNGIKGRVKSVKDKKFFNTVMENFKSIMEME